MGELHALIGPSGSGKTSCLRAIAGLLPIQEGRIEIGANIWLDTANSIDLPAHRRQTGLVFQSYALFPHKTALENIQAGLRHLKAPDRRDQGLRWLERVRLEGLQDRLPSELSGGQQQRVAMARALAREPQILLLDEPFAAVDQRTRQRLYRELALLRRELAMPILLVTHDLSEARMLADRMTVLHRGKALATDTPDNLIAKPPNPTVARILGERNIFQSEIKDATTLIWGQNELRLAQPHGLPSGSKVAWMIQASSVLLHRRDRPSNGERENPISGLVTEALPLGEQIYCVLKTQEGPEIAFTLSKHAAKRNGIERNQEARVSLLADGIHLMPIE